jgi:hypothetical protein
MAKATVSAKDFLAAISAEPVEHEMPGVGTVKVRALTAGEGQRLVAVGQNDNDEMMFQAVRLGLVEPALTDDDLAALRQSKAGPVMRLAAHIMRLSGMVDDELMQGEAGGGS